jgi:RNA polymerase sigma-70 factor (ECF subfamily)
MSALGNALLSLISRKALRRDDTPEERWPFTRRPSLSLPKQHPATQEHHTRLHPIASPKKRDPLPQPLVFKKIDKALPQARVVIQKTETRPKKKAVLFAGMTEAEVIRNAQAGDAQCFEALYMHNKRRIFSLCLRMTNNYAQAEDFTQEAFLQLYRKIGSFRGESAFSTWLHRLSVNIILMHWRKKGLAEVSLEETLEPQSEDGPRRDIGKRDDVLHGSIDRMTLDNAVASLAPGYRIIFVLHDVEGYEHNEIAEMLGCSIGNSKSQLHKARMKLRTLLPRVSSAKANDIQVPEMAVAA